MCSARRAMRFVPTVMPTAAKTALSETVRAFASVFSPA